MIEHTPPPVIPKEGLHVLHLFYTIEYGQWQLFSKGEQIAAKTNLASLVQEIRATDQTQLLMFSMVSPKADLGFMLLTPDLQILNAFEKRLTLALGADVLSPSYSYFSMTEQSESPCDSLSPDLPNWPVVCFYSIAKRRGTGWDALPTAERTQLLAERAHVDPAWQGRIVQLLTGSSGLDSMEWGVTLFAHDTFDIKRFEKAGSDFTESGDLFIGLQLPLDEIYRRVQL